MRIACVGGGPAGLYFALLMKLRDPGYDITVLERNTADSAQGWGVTLGRDLLGIGGGQSTFIVECSSETWAGLGFDTLSPPDGLSVLEKLFEGHLDDNPLLGQVQPGPGAGWLNFRTVTSRRW